MKNNKFETQAEIYQALLDGKKLSFKGTARNIKLVSGAVRWDSDNACHNSFPDPQYWSIYEPPKKKVKFYSYANSRGMLTNLFYSDNGAVWNGSELCEDNDVPVEWIKTNTFIEVDI